MKVHEDIVYFYSDIERHAPKLARLFPCPTSIIRLFKEMRNLKVIFLNELSNSCGCCRFFAVPLFILNGFGRSCCAHAASGCVMRSP